MRIKEHPILDFRRDKRISFRFNDKTLKGYEGETVAAALHAAGVTTLHQSPLLHRPRGFFCAIGKCSSCLMTVDGVPNVRVCITPLRDGMVILTATGRGQLPDKDPPPRWPWPGPYTDKTRETEVAIVGAGPAGLSAAIETTKLGLKTAIIDENDRFGGQLIKQTHMFFGSRQQHAQVRGIDIPQLLLDQIEDSNLQLTLGATVAGFFEGRTLAVVRGRELFSLLADKVIVAAGASENMLAFKNCDLPGVYGAGAVQTLMNVSGIIPGRRVLMVGAGNIGLIVSYQLLQAGVQVVEVIEAAPQIGGYHVHAAKIRRAGVPINTLHTIVEATGQERVESAIVARVDHNWRPVPGTERELEVSAICLAVGLSPTVELLFQTGCQAWYVPELGGHVAAHDHNLETTVPGVYVAGDASGIEEASTAMLEGSLAGLCAAESLGKKPAAGRRAEIIDQLRELRAGPFGEKARRGKEKMSQEAWRHVLQKG
ncbi:FAD-dependent oxidoreductase [Candidatus Zixiibacteriota bacterium]